MILRFLNFELRIFLKKRRRKLLGQKEGIRRHLSFVVPAQFAKTGQPLSAIFGQVQLNTLEFVNDFNNRTSIYAPGYPVFVDLIVDWEGKYEYKFLNHSFVCFVEHFLYKIKDKVYLSIFDLCRLMDIYKLLYKRFDITDQAIFRQVIGILRNFRVDGITIHSRFSYLILYLFYLKRYYVWFVYFSSFVKDYLKSNDFSVKKVKNKIRKKKKKRKQGIRKKTKISKKKKFL